MTETELLQENATLRKEISELRSQRSAEVLRIADVLTSSRKREFAICEALLHAPTPAEYRLLIIGLSAGTATEQECLLASNEYEALYNAALSPSTSLSLSDSCSIHERVTSHEFY